ncbi:succinyldiaminopimelate transaminase [Helicobacter sp. MIT 14-3879]|uniref:succinyldiaminopimelate transaminase n=1 Tax=Helicobacter sp. MIT 14-3879 TaxID=2040649 RepID=UPI000E1E4EA1|nr:succinyldiaminopimelate transaminase [Helicobacter sp. MIT 14-3879]RDU61427.1 succinyldiaminopimelate transaminase [Helicobacter sp. MIT 14-3879]
MRFNPYPFEKLRYLLKDCKPQKAGINLSIGEPAFSPPHSVLESICKNATSIRYYPTLQQDLIKSQRDFIAERFHVNMQDDEIIPTFGSREVLFNFPQFLFLSRKPKSHKPVIAFPNPFYQIYEGAQIANHADVIYMPLTNDNDFKPMLSKQDLAQVDVVILNSPNNPTGQILSLEELTQWAKWALEYDFIVINDECYSEIYEECPPPSILEVSKRLESCGAKHARFKNIFAINSISKRLSAPGLRSGFIAGDKEILQGYRVFRTYVGISMPLVLQEASIIAWREREYAESIRQKFAINLKLAREIFSGCRIFPYTFYLWLYIDSMSPSFYHSSDESFTKELFIRTGHTILPGSYLGREGAGKGFVRIALTQEEQAMKKSLLDIQALYQHCN